MDIKVGEDLEAYYDDQPIENSDLIQFNQIFRSHAMPFSKKLQNLLAKKS
jgi:hypothetical protein